MCWSVKETSAQLDCGSLQGSVVIDAYKAHFHAERWDQQTVNGVSVLGYIGINADTPSLNLVESYARGSDFVATFEEIGVDRIAPQLYWRASFLERFAATKLELVVSIKTDLLDSRPVSTSLTSIRGDAVALHAASVISPRFEVLNVSPTRQSDVTVWHPGIQFSHESSRGQLFVFRLREQKLSFAQMVHPSDFVLAQIIADSQLNYCLSASLFHERLEKGVIRRGRICGWFMPSENDLETAVALARQFVDEPLPLTA